MLELAAGTGQWTRILAESAAELVVTDASPEMLSHVPSNRLPAFWAVLDRLLATDGRIFFVDEGPHDEWREDWLDRDAGIVRRPLADGSVHRAIKVLWRAEDLRRRLDDLGWDASITTSGPFYCAIAARGGQSAESTT